MGRQITPIVKNLLIINIGVFILVEFLRSTFNIDVTNLFSYHYPGSPDFQIYQFVTYMFMHGSFMHLFSNMFGLFIFGPLLEQVLGSKRFLQLYMIAGIGTGLIYGGINYFEMTQIQDAYYAFVSNPTPQAFIDFFTNYGPEFNQLNPAHRMDFYEFMHTTFPADPSNKVYINEATQYVQYFYDQHLNYSMVGASGAIFALIMAFGLIFPNMQLMLLFPPIPIKAKFLVMFYGAYEIYELMLQSPGDNVAHLAHILGMGFAYVLLKMWKVQRLY
ncbi:rhomboid family intramembrane serine protease [Sediminitomix flava]|uniref:Rhomboid family protein n=1 Tax=Sediminitomix flava TaxID=379075 RepID=A0A315Z0A7_SEDFL|nr:rhomboid family intramembrane serine protease [Sediminitomix flava]PWJ36068.1 rhomboid family protein [Sediminitomix flava]